jgi:hypothetical protein
VRRVDFDDELSAMQALARILESLDEDGRRRAAIWLADKYAAPDESAVEPHFQDVTAFLEYKAPQTKTARLACLVYWVQVVGGNHSASIRQLNDLNRDAGGQPFADASSTAQSAIAVKGHMSRNEPGHLQLTRAGLRFVRNLPERA